jgi:hypothetical protein
MSIADVDPTEASSLMDTLSCHGPGGKAHVMDIGLRLREWLIAYGLMGWQFLMKTLPPALDYACNCLYLRNAPGVAMRAAPLHAPPIPSRTLEDGKVRLGVKSGVTSLVVRFHSSWPVTCRRVVDWNVLDRVRGIGS